MIHYYKFVVEESDPVITCRECGAIVEPGETVIAAVPCRTWNTHGRMTEERPNLHEVYAYYDEDCFEEEFRQCDDCGRWSPADAMTWIPNEESSVCDDCITNYHLCDHCGNYFLRDDVYTDDYDNCICSDCYDRYNYRVCDNCGRICDSDEGEWDGGYFYCEECAEEHRFVHDYGYKPSPIFHRHNCADHFDSTDSDGSEPLYLGVELEVDEGRNCSCVMDEYDEDDVYCKHDGSLGNYGFEIVSHPRTLESHKEFDWDSIMKTCVDNGYKSHDTSTCGFHVHVSRSFFGEYYEDSDYAAAKLIILVSRFWDDFIVPFSRRESRYLNKWARKPTDDEVVTPEDDESEILRKLSNVEGSRYKAINLRNDDTIEFRIFRGTLNYETFIATLEFVDGICRWVDNHTLEETVGISLPDFLSSEEFADCDTMRKYIKRREIAIENGFDEEEI